MFDSLGPLLLLLVVLGGVSYFLLGRPKPPARGSRTAMPIRRRSPWVKRLPILLMAGAVLFLALSFTQFRFLRNEGSAGTVILTLDVSDSMNRTDVAPSRMEAAVSAVRAFFEDLPAELRVGLVTFASVATTLVPPTTAHDEVIAALENLPRDNGTVIGDGLTAALDALDVLWERDGMSKAVVVLLSDGRDTGSVVSPEEAALRAGEADVPVHTVVLGRADPTDEGGANEDLLEGIAEASGGSPYTADSAEGLLRVYETLRSEISTELAISGSGSVFVGVAAVFAIAATVALLLRLRSDY